MKKGKEFIFPENVDKDYGIWKDYTLKDFGIAGLAGLVGLIFIAIPPYGLILVRRIVKSSATFCRRKLHLDFSIPRPCVDGYLNL